jgi:hypothetical protein
MSTKRDKDTEAVGSIAYSADTSSSSKLNGILNWVIPRNILLLFTKKQDSNLIPKYMLSFVEEAIMNPDYQHLRGGRIEILSDDSPYSVEEIRFLLPPEIYLRLRERLELMEF